MHRTWVAFALVTLASPLHAAWVDHDAAQTGIAAVDEGKVLDFLGHGWIVGAGGWVRDDPSEDPPMPVDQIRYWFGQRLVTMSGDYWIWSSPATWTNLGPVPSAASVGSSARPTAGRAVSVPNPTASSTDLRFSLAEPSDISIRIVDAAGRVIRDFESGSYPAGEHGVVWDGRDSFGRDVPPGIYFSRIAAGKLAVLGRIVVAR
ncbi:MAG: FlgD immunoglobulin-like domain containing protein [Candidatus Eisenbacteria bacterium]